MMDSVAEEKSLRISLECLEILARAVSLIVLENVLDNLPDRKIISAVLHPDDVAAIFCRLGKMIDIFLLLKCQFIPSRHLIPHNLEVRELVHKVLEILFSRFVRTRDQGCGHACCCNHFY